LLASTPTSLTKDTRTFARDNFLTIGTTGDAMKRTAAYTIAMATAGTMTPLIAAAQLTGGI
jgi:hypothetical protein